jgi:hypothetical protein
VQVHMLWYDASIAYSGCVIYVCCVQCCMHARAHVCVCVLMVVQTCVCIRAHSCMSCKSACRAPVSLYEKVTVINCDLLIQ